MSETNPGDVAAPSDAVPFPSLVALRQAHTGLLAQHRELGDATDLMVDVVGFIQQGRATGILLDDRDDRWDAQSILDYWVAVLYRARFEDPPDATLVDPDPEQIPELADSQYPYPGLDPLGEDDREDLLGRQELLAEILKHLEKDRLLAVVGPAAGGKSSLVMAGILPALRSGAVPGSESWCYYPPITPGSHPLAALAQLFERKDVDSHVGSFKQDPEHLAGLVAQRPAPALLIVDQFEELFTFCHDEQARAGFVANLASLISTPDQRHTVIVILDTEFEELLRTGLGDGAPAPLSTFQSRFEEARKRVTAFSAAELRTLIRKPADAVGLRFDDGVVEALIQDVLGEPAAPLLLQFVLRKLWAARERNRITWEAYKGLAGEGYGKLLARTAEAFYRELDRAEQGTARRVLLQMIGFSESLKATSQRVLREKLYGLGQPRDQVDAVLDGLAEQGLVRCTNGDPPSAAGVGIIHDSLAHEWRRLNDWLKEGWEDRRWLLRLRTAARQWAATGRDEGALWRRIGLLEMVQDHEELGELEREFIEESRRAIEREEERRLAAERAKVWRQRSAVLLVLLLLAAAAFFVAWTQYRAAKREHDRAEEQLRLSTARELAYAATFNRDRDAELGILLATHAVSATRDAGEPVTYEAENALHWALAASRVELTLFDEAVAMTDVAFSPDGQTLVTANLIGKVVAWDPTSGQEQRVFSLGGGVVYDVAFSADGSRLAAAGTYGPVRVWSLDADSNPLVLPGPEGAVRAFAFSPDGEWLATVGFDETAMLWHLDSDDEPILLVGHTDVINDIAFSPDGTLVATASDDDTARVWQAVDGTPGITLTGHSNDVQAIAFSPDGGYLVTASKDCTAKIWETDTGREVRTLEGHTNTVMDVAVHGSWVATASADRTAKVWDARTGEELLTLSGHTAPIVRVTFRPDGGQLATASEDWTARVWDLNPSQEWLTVDHGSEIEGAAFSPDGRRLVTAGKDDTAKVWDATTGALLYSLPGHQAPVFDVAFDARGERLATLSRDAVVALWDAATGMKEDTHSGYSGNPLGVAFTDDGLRLATAGEDQTVSIWGDDPGQPLLVLWGHRARDIAFSADGKLVAIADESNRVVVWDAESDQLVSEARPSGRTRYFGVALSPDGSRVAAGGEDGLAKIWDVASGELLHILQGHTNSVRDVAFSPDGTRLATASFDRIVRVWDVETGEEQLVLPGHADRVWSVAFSHDGTRLVSASLDGTARVYLLDLDALTSHACDRVTRNLTWQEWQTYLGDEAYHRTCPDLPGHYTVVSHLRADGSALIREGQFDAALEVLKRAKALDPTQAFVPEETVARALTLEGEVDAALEILEQAREQDPSLALVPEEVVAAGLVELAQRRADEQAFDDALAALYQAVELDPGLSLIPELEVAKAQARHYADEGQGETAIDTLLQMAQRYPDYRREIAETLVDLAEGQAFGGAYGMTLELVYAATELEPAIESEYTAGVYDSACWQGSLDGQAEEMLPACERAVALDPEHGGYRASRGLARALMGDLAGAADDFRFLLEWERGLPEDDPGRYMIWVSARSSFSLSMLTQREGAFDARRAQFETWLQELEAGQNPFDAATLQELREEYLGVR